MPFVQGSAIDKAMKGSMEQHAEVVHQCIREHLVDHSLKIVATFEDHVLAFTEEHNLLKISYKVNDEGSFEVVSSKASKTIPVIQDEDVAVHVSKGLKSLAKKMMSGKKIERTQVRELAALTQKDEDYWMTDIVSKLDETCGGNCDWYKMYEANIERIRTSLHGRIRDIESVVPKTRYTKIAAAKLDAFKDEMKESLQIIKGLFAEYSVLAEGQVFDDKQEFLIVVRESLIAEAQAVVGLLGKAEKLLGQSELPLVANAHDKLADRARTMAMVSAYINGRAQPTTDKE